VMNQPKVYLFDVEKFLSETQGWSLSEIGVYMRLLAYQWTHGALPNDTQRLCKTCGIDHGNFRKLWEPMVIRMFEKNGDGLLRNPRLEVAREKQAKYLERQSNAGKERAKQRYGNVVQLKP